MREALLKVLGAMNMEMPNKVLIAWKLTEDDKIYQFLLWLRDNVPEDQVNGRQNEIVNKALRIARGDEGEQNMSRIRIDDEDKVEDFG